MTGGAGPATEPDGGTYALSALEGNVLLIGGYGAGNIGDEAILSGLVREAAPSIRTLSVVSHDPAETRRLHEATVPGAIGFEPVEPSPATLLSQLAATDHVVVGGGGIFSRYMGPYAAKIPYFTLAAQAMRRSVHWTAVGVYPSTPRSVMYPLHLTMDRSASVTVRDPVSLETLHGSGISDARLVPDPAMALSPDTTAGRTLLTEAGLSMDERLLGIAARRVMDDQHNARLQRAYREVADHFTNEGWQVALVPFCRHPYEAVEQDDRVCASLASEFDSATVLSYERPEALLGAVSQLDAIVATRLHSMLFAQRTETPFVAVEYSAKVTSLLEHYDRVDRGITLEDVSGAGLVDVLDSQRSLV